MYHTPYFRKLRTNDGRHAVIDQDYFKALAILYRN